METAIQDVLSIIEYNDLDDIVLVGHSFAGKVVHLSQIGRIRKSR
jgi:hypothetical protein